MYGKYLRWIGVTALMCTIGLVFLGAAPDRESVIVEDLLEKRADVMGNVLLGKITYDEGKELLKEIESDKLYSDDLASLEKYRNTDIDIVTHMKVDELEKTSQIYDRMTFVGVISWRYAGTRGSFGHKDEYQIGVAKDGNEYRLISFELQ